jgi:glycosyltransferase involved in cell wall biosynthesis
MKDSKVSIIIPVYNGSNYLKEAIDSALAQTYKNIEVIVVNDGSNDGGRTEKIAKTYGNKIRYFEKRNGGVASALNLGISKMKGEWFAWLSHDDLFPRNRIKSDMKYLSMGYKASFTDLEVINEDKKKIGEMRYYKEVISSPKECWEMGALHMCSLTINKRCFKRVGLFNRTNLTMQDVEFALKLSRRYKIVHNARTMTKIREHTKKGTYTQKDQHNKDSLYFSNIVKKEFDVAGFFPNFSAMNNDQKGIASNWMGELYRSLGDYSEAKKYYERAYKYHKTIKSVLKKYVDIEMFLKAIPFKKEIVTIIRKMNIKM